MFFKLYVLSIFLTISLISSGCTSDSHQSGSQKLDDQDKKPNPTQQNDSLDDQSHSDFSDKSDKDDDSEETIQSPQNPDKSSRIVDGQVQDSSSEADNDDFSQLILDAIKSPVRQISLSRLECEQMLDSYDHIMSNNIYHSVLGQGESSNNYTDQLSKNIFTTILYKFDPLKVVFSLEEINELKKKYSTNLDTVLDSRDCQTLIQFVMTALIRSLEYQQFYIDVAKSIIKNGPFKLTHELITHDQTKYHFDYTDDFEVKSDRVSKYFSSVLHQHFYQDYFHPKDLDQLASNVLIRWILREKGILQKLQSSNFLRMFLLDILTESLDYHSDFSISKMNLSLSNYSIGIYPVKNLGISIANLLGNFVVVYVDDKFDSSSNQSENIFKIGDRIKEYRIDSQQDWEKLDSLSFLNSIKKLKTLNDPSAQVKVLRASSSNFTSDQDQDQEQDQNRQELIINIDQSPGSIIITNNRFEDIDFTIFSQQIDHIPLVESEDISTQTTNTTGEQMVSVGYIAMDDFFVSSQDQSSPYQQIGYKFTQVVERLKDSNAQVILLDLRYNQGGLIHQASIVLNSLLKKGDGGFKVHRTFSNRMERNLGPTAFLNLNAIYQRIEALNEEIFGVSYTEIPFVVLTSRSSASAAEYIAQGIKSAGRGIVIGDDRTYGKGTISSYGLFPQSLSTGVFFAINGISVEKNGVNSDLIIPAASLLDHVRKDHLQLNNVSLPPEYAVDVDYGFRSSRLLSSLSLSYVNNMLLTDNDSTSDHLPYSWVMDYTLLSDKDSLVSQSVHQVFSDDHQSSDQENTKIIGNNYAYNSEYFSLTSDFAQEFVEKRLNSDDDNLHSYYYHFNKNRVLLRAMRSYPKDYNDGDGNKDNFQQFWDVLRSKDHVLQHALFISSHYYQKCTCLGTDFYQPSLENGCVQDCPLVNITESNLEYIQEKQ